MTQGEAEGISRAEYDRFKDWLTANKTSLPDDVSQIGNKILDIYWNLFKKGKNPLQLLKTLREKMGFLPKSEKGSQGNAKTKAESVENGALSCADRADQDRMAELKLKRQEALQSAKRYGLQIGAIKRRAKALLAIRKVLAIAGAEQAKEDAQLVPAEEAVFSSPISESSLRETKLRVDREGSFEKKTGMHSAYDDTTRFEVKVQITQINYKVETVTNLETGKSVRACTDGEGPADSNLTWGSIESLVKMHAGFALPIHRISLMLGHEAFSPGKIYRTLEWAAHFFLPIYLHLPEVLSEADILSGDDTSTKVLDLADAPKGKELNLHQILDDAFRWRSQRADGKGDKKALNVTLITGRLTADPRSTIQFFRTHVGSFGNLITRILEMRSPKNRKIIIQGDLSSSNKPEAWIRDRFDIQCAGCGSHARRPIWRYREDDPEFCYYMLQCFAHLAGVEQLIGIVGRTEKNVQKYRRYARMIWKAIWNRCQATLTGIRPTVTTDSKHEIRQWPPQTYLYDAAKYIVDHYRELTLYLDEPRLSWTTNDQERGLRFEKCLLGAAKFKGNRNGRAVLDILRTILATCTAAQVEVADYLRWLYPKRETLTDNPENYTPFAYALYLDSQKSKHPPTNRAVAAAPT